MVLYSSGRHSTRCRTAPSSSTRIAAMPGPYAGTADPASAALVRLLDELLRRHRPVRLLDPVAQHADRRRPAERHVDPPGLAEPVPARLRARDRQRGLVRLTQLHAA